PSVCHLFSFIFHVIYNLHQPIHEAQIYFVFLCVGNPKTDLKGVTWAGKAEALLQAFGLSVGSCGLANVLTPVGWQLIDTN
ncbi:MAG: hypothetical protein KJ754_14885, partial [Bacteroidetes bacterium]|nr:hypothetical protein [Bacteroidota bacterium]MBU1580713.1 hypothetical protein [Bacteroidota bacterium]MBU2465690.1 hypothetical protein [Bacteroidota bacterium]